MPKQAYRFENPCPTGYVVLNLFAAGLWAVIENLGVLEMARLGMRFEEQWHHLTGKKRSSHARI
jgi:hypothetical protein